MNPSPSAFWLSALTSIVGILGHGSHGRADDDAVLLRRLPTSERVDIARQEAQRRFALGVLCERRQRYAEALDHFAAAVDLDPKAVAPKKALLPLYLALDRQADAVTLTRQILKLVPDDYETWYLHSRHLLAQGKKAEAEAALSHTVTLPSLRKDLPVLAQASLELARMQEDAGELDRAIGTLEKAIAEVVADKADLKPVELLTTLGRMCAAGAKHQKAIAAYQKAQEMLADDDLVAQRRLDYELSRVFADQGNLNTAIFLLDRYLETLPPGTEPYEMKVRLLKDANRSIEITPALKAAVERDPHHMALQLLLGRTYVEEKKYADAEKTFHAIVAESPSAEAYRGLFYVYQAQGRLWVALDSIDDAIAAGTESEENQADSAARNRARAMLAAFRDDARLSGDFVATIQPQQWAGSKPETRRFLAALALRARRFQMADELYRSCLEPNVSLGVQAVVYDGLLRALWSAGDHKGVVEICRKGMEQANALNQLPFHGNLARALVVLGKTKEAIAEADRAVELSDAGNRLAYRLLRVEILSMARRYDKAEAACQELLHDGAAGSDSRRIRHVLSNIYTATRAYERAEEQLRLILRDDPDDATANNDLGYILADQGKNLDEAEQLIRRALDVDEKRKQTNRGADREEENANAAYIDSLGWVLFRKGRLPEARRELERAVALPDGGADPVVWDHLGDVYSRLGDRGQARIAWEKAKSLYEVEKRRALDDSYNELKRKLRESDPDSKPRGLFEFGFSVFDWVKR